MRNKSLLKLLVIDDDQLYAERLVLLLSSYYKEITLGFLDDKEELLKSLRQQWDVLIFGKGYDLNFNDVATIIQEQGLDLPIIHLMSDETIEAGYNDEGLPVTINGTMVRALSAKQEMQVIMAICLQQDHLRSRQQLKALQQVLSESEQRANILIKNSKSAVAYLDQGIHIFANDPYLKLFGFESMDELIGVPVIDLIAGGDDIKSFKSFLRQFDKGNRSQLEFSFESRRTNGETFEAKLQLSAATLDAQPVTQVIIQQNNASSAEIAKRLAVAERRDSLTGLNNRLGFEEEFEKLHQSVMQQKSIGALLYIHLDNIGKISSSLGLQGVDAVIKQVGYTLKQMLPDAVVSRFSDSTFTILLTEHAASDIDDIAERIRLQISDMIIDVDKRTTSTTVSIGAVNIDHHAPKPQVLLERAVDAVNYIKMTAENKGDAYHLYDPSQHASTDDNALVEALLHGITQNRFELLFQPIYDIKTNRSDFFEVYLRLPLADSDNTVLTPNHFMSVAKSHNLLEKIDRWILINASKKLSELRKSHPQAQVLVPLTGASLIDKNLPDIANQLITAIGGEDNALILHFDEQDITSHLTVAKSLFAQLRQINCQVGIRNFGMSVKSIEAADFVKPTMVRLTQDYVNDLSQTENLEIIKTVITRTNDVGVDVLIPYIEEAATMSSAWSIGARYLQGDYLEKPNANMHISSES